MDNKKRSKNPYFAIYARVLKFGDTWILCEDLTVNEGWEPCIFLISSKRGLTEGLKVNDKYKFICNCSINKKDKDNDKLVINYWLYKYTDY